MLYVIKKRPKVISKWELLAVIIMFGAVLYFLHPDKRTFFKEILMSESTNYDLTEAYLSNILRLEPQNAEYIYEFTKILIQKGKYDLAETTFKALQSLPNKGHITKKATILQYEMLKRQYYMTDDPKIRAKLRKKMIAVFKKIVNAPFFFDFNLTKMNRWLNEAWFLQSADLRLLVLTKMAAKYPNDATINENMLQLALMLHKRNLIEIGLKHLQRDLKNSKGEAFKRRLTLLISGYQAVGKSQKASTLLLQHYQRSGDLKELVKAIEILVWSKHYSQAVELARKYETVLLKNRWSAEKLLDLYLQTGHVKDARRIALKIMKRFHQ